MRSGLGKVLIRRRRRPPVPPGPLLFMPRLAAVNVAATDGRPCALGLALENLADAHPRIML
jgi:hypothetical protein